MEVIELEEEAGPRFPAYPTGKAVYPTAGVGEFLERRDGGMVIGDALLPRVRAHSADGGLEAAFGRYGEGPFEFKHIAGLAETPAGKIVVSSFSSSLTFLNADLTPDSLVPVPGILAGKVWALGDDLLLRGSNTTAPGWRRQEDQLWLHRVDDGRLAWSSWESGLDDKPYAGGLTGLPSDLAGDSIYIMAGAFYPLTVLNRAGDSVGTIGHPPPWFRVLPDIPRGAFAFRSGETPDYGALPKLLASFDLVEKVSVVGGDYLVLTLGQHDPARPSPPFRLLHATIEIYNRHTGQKLVESVRLPEGSWVLGGGRYLYVLVDRDLPPWRIAKYRLIVED